MQQIVVYKKVSTYLRLKLITLEDISYKIYT